MKKTKGLFIYYLLLILVTFLYIPKIYQGYRTLSQLERELREITIESEKLNEKMNELTLQVEEFDDLYFVEKFVRNNLNMKKKNEEIYRVIYEEEQN